LVVGRYFRNVKNGPSPEWLQQRLRAIGLRPISALVDITNFVTYDLGRPLHVFDADKLAGDLTMRMAADGEEILALDGRSYTLDSEMVVIADAEAAHAIGGVMGGENTGCQDGTTNVFLEVALFDPIRVATTGRKLNINSDARYRFERGVDPESAWWGAEVAARLVLEFCGGEPSHPVHAGEMPDWQRQVTYHPKRVESLGGVDVPKTEQKRILEALGFIFDGEQKDETGDAWTLQVPPWRRDAHGEADLVEDVLRIHGFDQVPVVPMRSPTPLPRNILTPLQRRTRLAQRALAARGLFEAVTWSFMRRDHAALFGGGGEDMQLANPISVELDAMRPSILPNLITAAGRNADKGLGDSALFEVGPQYRGLAPDDQSLVASGIRNGDVDARHWEDKPRAVDVFDAKADALAALDAAGAPVASLQVSDEAPDWYHPGRSGSFRLGNKVLGTFGEIHPGVLRRLDVAGPVVGFEVMLDSLPPQKAKASKTRPLLRPSAFQPVERDFAFVVDADVPADKLVRAAWGADKALVSDVALFDVYEGENIGAGKKSIALSVTLQPTEATLTDDEIDAIAQKVVANVAKQTGGELRG
jgi:phenylalanyl-tRNA synthetase beta chain